MGFGWFGQSECRLDIFLILYLILFLNLLMNLLLNLLYLFLFLIIFICIIIAFILFHYIAFTFIQVDIVQPQVRDLTDVQLFGVVQTIQVCTSHPLRGLFLVLTEQIHLPREFAKVISNNLLIILTHITHLVNQVINV